MATSRFTRLISIRDLAAAGPSAIMALAPERGEGAVVAEITLEAEGKRVIVPIYKCSLFAESSSCERREDFAFDKIRAPLAAGGDHE